MEQNCVSNVRTTYTVGVEAYRRLSAAGDIKASHKLAALTGAGDHAMKGTLHCLLLFLLIIQDRGIEEEIFESEEQWKNKLYEHSKIDIR